MIDCKYPECMVIPAEFKFETARWDRNTNNYVDIKHRMEYRDIHVRVENDPNGRKLLKFIGGPTGFETYYLESLLDDPDIVDWPTFCINGGTVNSWPKCTVDWQPIVNMLHDLGYKFKGVE